jgi:putative tryptophan/tyrosine transport system substrate-binding protein
MKRRKFIALLGSAVAGWSLSARAQPQETRRVGFVIGLDDAEAQARFASFREGLERRGWIDGRNLEIVARFGAADPDRNQRYVAELIALHPAAIVTPNTSTVIALMKEAPTIPVVIAQMGDPVTLGFAGSVAHPDRNVTGFTDFEPAMATKWLELLREVAPLVKRLVILMEPESSDFYIRALKPAASSLGVELKELRVITGGDAELERTIAAFAATPNSIQPSSSWSSI